MIKIIVAGCGHGGLTAAANLAEKGYDVTVYEKCKREELGYDWHDSVSTSLFAEAGLPAPDESVFLPPDRMCYYNPKKNVKVVPDLQEITGYAYISRKFLINYLIDHALECGVKIIFECKIVSSICSADRVIGMRYIQNGETKEVRGDLIIDACGMFSPVRLSLPDKFMVSNKVDKNDVFYAWRGYFKKTDDTMTEPESNIYFYHCYHRGMDWAITKDGYMDILVGGFGELTKENVEDAIADFEAAFPCMGDTLINKPKSDKIPVGKSLPVFVCGGYAAVGNSAYMTEPLSGSGIDLSMYAGRLLAETVSVCENNFSAENLWMYNYLYIKNQAEKRYNSAIIKNLMASLNGKDIDFLMQKKIMTQKEIAGTGGKYTFAQNLQKLWLILRPRLFKPLINMLIKTKRAAKLKKSVPVDYTQSAIRKWNEDYAKI